MKIRKIVSWCNYDVSEDCSKEHPTGVSATVPDQVLSMREMLRQYVRGESVPTFEGTYQDDDDDNVYPDVARMDFAEKSEFSALLKQENVAEQDRISKEQRAKRKSEDAVSQATNVSEPTTESEDSED